MSEKNALYANVSINIFTKIKKFSLSEQFSSQFRCLLTASNFIQKDSIETVIPLEPLNSLVVAPLIFLRSLPVRATYRSRLDDKTYKNRKMNASGNSAFKVDFFPLWSYPINIIPPVHNANG